MKKILLVLGLLASTLSYSQNTFYTKGLEVYNNPANTNDFNHVSTNENHIGKVSIKFDFSYVEVSDDKVTLNYIVESTRLLDEDDPDKGYSLLCESGSGQKAQIAINLESRCVFLYIKKDNEDVDAYALFIQLID